MGIAYAGKCYKDAPAVLDAYKLQFPYFDGIYSVNLVSATNTASAITSTVSYQIFSSATVTNRALTINTSACTETMASIGENQLFLIVALVGCFLLGFKTGFRA